MVKWYCALENLKQANQAVLRLTREMKLRIHLKDNPDLTYTSSDGQKVEVAQDSLLARSSFKYFGNRKGVAAYNYTDDTLLLFDSLVFSAGDREATYVLNGLVNTQVVDSDVLRVLHETLDKAVLDAYGFAPDTDLPTNLLTLNHKIVERERANLPVQSPVMPRRIPPMIACGF